MYCFRAVYEQQEDIERMRSGFCFTVKKRGQNARARLITMPFFVYNEGGECDINDQHNMIINCTTIESSFETIKFV